jgi:hypothetical protein
MFSRSEIWLKVFKKKEEIVTRKIAGETILVPISGKLVDMQRIFSLNPVAEYIWQHLDGKKHLGDIRNKILTSYNVEKEKAEEDIQEFITELLKENLIIGLH